MRILIVDDSKAMRSIVLRAVKAVVPESSTFQEAGNGAEALAVVRQGAVDLVLSDWNMPEMSGIELLQAVRREGIGVKFGFVTSESNPATKDLALQSGAAFILCKPFSPDAVKAALAPVLA